MPIVVVLKAMGMECDQEIVQLIGFEDDVVELLSPSLEEPYNIGIYSRDQVLFLVTALVAIFYLPQRSTVVAFTFLFDEYTQVCLSFYVYENNVHMLKY